MNLPKLKLSPFFVNLAFKIFDTPVEEMVFSGSRVLEYSFVLEKLIGKKQGRVLDIGCTYRFNYLTPTLVMAGLKVYGLDTREFRFKHPNFHYIKQNILNTDFPDNYFDYVVCVSTIEHIGVEGPFGQEEHKDGDEKALKEIYRIVKPDGKVFITTEYGKQKLKHDHRIYSKERIQKIFSNFIIKDERYYIFDKNGIWLSTTEEVASNTEDFNGHHAIAMYELLPKSKK